MDNRFQKNIWLTHHAKYAMEKRDIPEAVVCDLIETGEIKRKDNLNVWIFKHYPEHSDNPLCVAAVISQAVMTDWKEREIPL